MRNNAAHSCSNRCFPVGKKDSWWTGSNFKWLQMEHSVRLLDGQLQNSALALTHNCLPFLGLKQCQIHQCHITPETSTCKKFNGPVTLSPHCSLCCRGLLLSFIVVVTDKIQTKCNSVEILLEAVQSLMEITIKGQAGSPISRLLQSNKNGMRQCATTKRTQQCRTPITKLVNAASLSCTSLPHGWQPQPKLRNLKAIFFAVVQKAILKNAVCES